MQWLIAIVTTIYVAVLAFELATGRVSMRDERRRLRPAPAALLAVGALVVLGGVLSALVG